MEKFLNEFLDFIDKSTDWKENNETTNSQVITHFIANNDKLVRELVDKLCDGKETSDELGDSNMPLVMPSFCDDEEEEDLDEEKPDFKECMCCGNVQQYGMSCNKCCGPLRDGFL